jgi:uncharacterized protein
VAAPGIVIRAAHFPGRAPIDAYGNGGFRFAGMSHRGSLLCLPSGIHGWDAADAAAALDLAVLAPVLAESDGIEVLLIGTGSALVPIPADLRAAFRARGISADSMGTGAAVRTFNVLLGENRAVAAALVAVA